MDETNVNDEVNIENDGELEANETEDEYRSDQEEGGEESEVEMGGDPEGEGDGDSEGGEPSDEGREARKTRAQAQIERLKEENKRLKEDKRKAAKEGKLDSNSDMMAKAFLAATFNIKEAEAQEEALRLADKFDMPIDELMQDDDWKGKVESVQKRVINRRKVAANTGGAAQKQKNSPEYLAKYFEKNQAFPEGASVQAKSDAIDHLRGKQKQYWE